MSRASHEHPAATTIAVLHGTAGTIRALIARGTEVGAWQTFEAGRHGEVADWLGAEHAASVIVVLPSAAVTCRTFSLPDADEAQLTLALALQAEAHTNSGVPEHRRATAVLHAAAGESSRSGILVAWPPVAGDPGVPDLPSILEPGGGDVRFIADIAALAALLNGERPDQPLLWADRHDGSLAMAISHANGAILRAARVDTGAAWAQGVARALAETALSVGHTPAFTESMVASASATPVVTGDTASVLLTRSVIDSAASRAAGAPQDDAWWRHYGIAMGAFLATTDQLAPLAQLRLAAPSPSPSRARRLATALSNPRVAVKFVAVCLLVATLAPLLASGLRLGLLKVKLPELSSYLTTARQANVELAIYAELKENAWPMTKLLSDIACSTPQSIDIDTIRLRHGKDLTIDGRAKPDSKSNLSAQEVVTLFQDNLRSTNIFEEIEPTWSDPNSFGAYEFSLNAKVAHPYHRNEYPLELDYGRWPLADRLYGESPDAAAGDETIGEPQPGTEPLPQEPAAQVPPPAETPRERPSRRSRPRPGFGPDAPQSHENRMPGNSTLPPSQDIPESMTPEQIEAMSLAEAQEAWADVAHSLRRGVVDKDTRARLRKEFRLIRDRIRELKNQ